MQHVTLEGNKFQLGGHHEMKYDRMRARGPGNQCVMC
jgi:hypothetical protein